jgi:general secretion pathway protein E
MKSPWDMEDENTIGIDREETTNSKKAEKPPVHKDPTVRTMIQKAKVPGVEVKRVETEVKVAIEDTLRKFSDKLGEILISINSNLTREQIEESVASNIEKSSNEMIGEILLKKKLITEDELLRALSVQSGIPITKRLEEIALDMELTNKIPIAFAKKHYVIPYQRQGNTVFVAISNPNDLSVIDDLRILLQSNIKPTLGKKTDIMNAINRAYEPTSKVDRELHQDLMDDLEEQDLTSVDLNETQDLLDSDDEAPIIRLVNTLLFRAIKERASDIHVEPAEKDISVRFRIDGILYEVMRPPKKAQASITSRVKIMADLDIAEKRIPQDGRIKTKLGGRSIDIRVSTLPTSHGERIVMRILDTTNVVLDLEDLGFDPGQLAMIKKITQLSHGIFLVTGPTGSGKTSTLYACLSSINSKDLNIITVEDPVEIQLNGIGQIQVNTKVNLTFASGLRSILRQDPDVIMVGEIRDLETAEIAIQASLTGHFVFSTIHTNDAAGSITRLVDMGVEPFLVSSSLVAAMAQRLVRRLCKECKEPYSPTAQELKEIGITPEQLGKNKIYHAKGCSACAKTGYQGRMGIYEIMPVDETIRGMILKNTDSNTIKKAAQSAGVKTLRDDGANKVLKGQTTIEEVLRVTQEDMLVA